MKNLNWSKMRFICIFLAFSLVILGYFFRNHYYYQFLGLAYICIAISNICLYLFELKEKGHSSKSYILGAIMLVILGALIPGYSFIVFRISNPRSFIESFIESFIDSFEI